MTIEEHQDHPDQPIRAYEDLLSIFVAAEKPAEAWRIGPEMEKCGVEGPSQAPVHYDGDKGVLRIFDELVKTHGWQPEREFEGSPIIALRRADDSITLEPGAQFELSAGAVRSVHDVCASFRRHMQEIGPISKELGITWLGLGFHPFATREEFHWVPKARYGIMRQYLPRRGQHALDMMLRTSTVQANYDYSSESDAMRKMRVALALSPLTTALFANSPWYEGVRHEALTYRGRVWLDVDPDRSGLLPALWKRGAKYKDYIEWALDVPMFMFKRGEHKFANTGQTFRSFWNDGFRGEVATIGDWLMHLNTLFPEVRLKKTIEVRGADAQGNAFGCALPALWTGIFYDSRALAEAEALIADWSYQDVAATRGILWKLGLRTNFRGETFAALAERVIEIAEGGLARRGFMDSENRDERVHLARLKELVAKGKTPAEQLLELVNADGGNREAIVRHAALNP